MGSSVFRNIGKRCFAVWQRISRFVMECVYKNGMLNF